MSNTAELKNRILQLERQKSLLLQSLQQAERVRAQGQKAIKALKQTQTQLREAVATAEAATSARSAFLASMSHELRTPLNGIIGMTDLLLDLELTAEAREFSESIHHSGEALMALINDILDFSKIDAGKLDLELLSFDLRAEVDAVLDIVTNQAQTARVELISLVHAEVPQRVHGDPTRVRQILLNLLSNAIKFTPQDGEIEVDIRTDEGDMVCFSVRDTGVGIPADRQEGIFEAFEQAEDSTTRHFGGTGLGLAICRRLCALMGGEITVSSTVGEGSVFTFRIPLPADLQPGRAPQRCSLDPAIAAEHKRVLVTDDNATNRRVLEYKLRARGFDVVLASDASRAEALLRDPEQEFAFGLLDDQMPGLSGLELAHRVQNIPHRAGFPFILLTSTADHSRERLHEAGLAGYLAKPVKDQRLWQCIATVLGTDAGVSEKRIGPVTAAALDLANPSGLRILLVEDNLVNQRVASTMLRKAGLSCDIASNGIEALAALEQHTYALVLMDCQMPEMDGFETTRRLRLMEQSRGGHLPVVAMTAAAMTGDRERCLEAGMDGYLTKPFRPEQLFAAIRQWAEAA